MGGYDEESLRSDSTSECSATNTDGSTSLRQKSANGKPLRPIAGNTFMELVAGIFAATSVATSVAAMVIQPANIIFAAGGLSCAIGPYAYWQQRKLTDVIALQETHKALSEQVNRLGRENMRLRATVDDLSLTIDHLEDVEQALDVITQTQGQSIEAFEAQVKDNRDILSKMQSNLKANVLQNLLQVVIRSDNDDNMTIEEHEIGGLLNSIRGINGVEVNETLFREAITRCGGSLQCVMDIIRNLMDDDVPRESEIFIIKD